MNSAKIHDAARLLCQVPKLSGGDISSVDDQRLRQRRRQCEGLPQPELEEQRIPMLTALLTAGLWRQRSQKNMMGAPAPTSARDA